MEYCARMIDGNVVIFDINGRIVQGAIVKSIEFDELDLTGAQGSEKAPKSMTVIAQINGKDVAIGSC